MLQRSIKSALNLTIEIDLIKVIGSEKSSNCARELSRYSHSFKPAREKVNRLYELSNLGCDRTKAHLSGLQVVYDHLGARGIVAPADRKHERN